MNYILYFSAGGFDIAKLNWLVANVSQQGVRWWAEIDTWERRMLIFKHHEDYLKFQEHFGL